MGAVVNSSPVATFSDLVQGAEAGGGVKEAAGEVQGAGGVGGVQGAAGEVQGASDRSEEAAAERRSEDHGDVDRILHLLPDVLGAGRRVSHV